MKISFWCFDIIILHVSGFKVDPQNVPEKKCWLKVDIRGKVDSTVKVNVIWQNPQKDVIVLDILAIILTRCSSW